MRISFVGKEEIGPHIGYLPQEIALFPALSLKILHALPEFDPQKVIQAAKMAHVHEMIYTLSSRI